MYDKNKLPILDLRQFYNVKERHIFLKELQYLARHIGFFYLVGHGLDKNRIKQIKEYAALFFSLPQQDKESISIENSPHFRGYTHLNGEHTQNTPDAREQIDIGTELEAIPLTSTNPIWTRLQGPNQWPKDWPDFQKVVQSWLFDTKKISIDLIHAFLLALGVKENVLDPFILNQPNESLKLIHYPKTDSTLSVQGVGAHKDTNILTLLLQDEVGGLQVLSKNTWIDVPYIEDAFVVNIGETLELATNGYLVANTHRVVSPKNTDRYSIAYFISPNLFAGDLPILDLPHTLKQLATGPTTDPNNPLLRNIAENNMKSKFRSHLNVTQKFYPDIYKHLNKKHGDLYEKN
ncbi:isopenicillin N synthase family oxygenase [Acinetobacter sp. B5B]|uniref:isopenicillin N synthase family dioxygenase n=1 Tax=Acinetobacter baretiae TaxID=2605383 RepID=UPI0018C250FD|nr:isopenicillin N synthase family oxygenase [Acinetobacter baretiae]MBF7681791.1 isopenicillin N synthase family oxygenase [Acinetobacter baretiae]